MEWWPPNLMEKAKNEGYRYFDREIRPLPKKPNGDIDELADDFDGNDVDAFRHAYVSGVFAQEYGEQVAMVLGWMNEWTSLASPRGSTNMDLWNNAVGRRLGLESESTTDLARKVKEALISGELIINKDDERKYQGAGLQPPAKDKSVVVLKESKKGANEHFYDLNSSQVMNREEFVARIEQGTYSGYGVRVVKGEKYPFSLPDGDPNNNLG